MEKTPCIKCNSQLWEYIKPYLEKWGYAIYNIDNFNKYPLLVLNYYANCDFNVTNLKIVGKDHPSRELVTNVEEFLERAARLIGLTYKKKKRYESKRN